MASSRISRASIANPAGALPTVETPAEFRVHALTLPSAAAGLRFDQALAQALPQYSRARLKTWIESGAVQVDGRPLRAKDRVLGGEQVRIRAALPVQDRVQAEAMPLDVVFRDRAVLVIEKPAGLVVHPGAGHSGVRICTHSESVAALIGRPRALRGGVACLRGAVNATRARGE